MWYRQEIELSIFILSVVLVVVISGLAVIVVLRLAQSAQSHDDHLVLGLALTRHFARLRTAHDPRRVRVRRPVLAQVIAQDIEREAGPGVG